jgi:putative FmdB family regulatory protein
MPFYEYVCTSCGAETEILQKLSDPPETECPVCHAQALSKHMSAAGFRLKGGGWYETDFKSDAKRNVAGDTAAPDTTHDAAKAEAHSCAAGACGHTKPGADAKAGAKEGAKAAPDAKAGQAKPAPATTAPSKAAAET